MNGDDLERRSFQFFRTRTVPQLCGFFDDDIWQRLVLQATLQEPTIRHAVFALGSLHERYESGDLTVFASNLDTAQGGLALQHYIRAIKHLITPSAYKESQSLDVFLVASVLFACFETLRGHIGSAISHLMSGVRILEESTLKDDSTEGRGGRDLVSFPYISKEKLIVLFNRLDSQVQQLTGTMPMTLQPQGKSQSTPLGFSANIPKKFGSLEEARNSLDYQSNGYVRFFFYTSEKISSGTWAETEIEPLRDYWSNQIASWDKAFDALMEKGHTMLDPKSRQAAWALKINSRLGSIDLRPRTSSILADEETWDLYMQECEDIVQFAEAIVDLDDSKRGNPANRKNDFSLDMSLVGPVYSVAHRCRDPILRRRAIALLKKAQRQDGVWDSTIAAKVAERIVAIEEGAVVNVSRCQDIPGWARINGVKVEFDKQERRGHFSYRRGRSQHQPAIEKYHETIYW